MSKIYSFDQLTDSVELLEQKPPRFIAWLLGFLCLILLGFMCWAYIGKIDIVSKGTAIIQGKSDMGIIRTQVAGIVDNVFVRSGDEVKKGDVLIQLKNQELLNQQTQSDQIANHLEKQKEMLEQLKKSIQSEKSLFSDGVDEKIREEYKGYEQGYQSLQNEKENEIKILDNSKTLNEQDDTLQGLIAEKENTQREIDSLKKQKDKENILDKEQQLLEDKIQSLESQQTSLKKREEQRKSTLEGERKKVEIVKEGKQKEKQYALKQYKESTIISVNQRITSLEQEIFVKKQEVNRLNNQSEATVIKAKKDGIVQLPFSIQSGDLIDLGQEIISIIPKEDEKKVKILLSAQEIENIKKGDKIQYSFKLKNTDKQIGTITYIPAHPILDKDSKTYMYELEATISTKELKVLHTGMVGRASVVTGEEPIWKFILRKLDFISG
ncbi:MULTISPECIES: HlyD family efflux transporter periplasmic adaptor subunit [Bacillus]|uniref:HlyD family efflux transporter periplasmic adaptor subunit n=1 Tax=Bacillus TaxID=1386 RepID=UPI00091712BD|nr:MULTISPECIES: biotin/lipoyl-binding protein [Bacillus]MED3269918.1 HlyD family efflux transporter periplasmic adaptor subunit [Bacillus thuringiensis]PFA76280.1 hemolysin D [Bacillus thuringiensis]PFB40352.1 hemolysin D [Bacillus thuringiensis]PFE98776.1 hemolysin D [Bacillus thuringiensis]PFV38482.1 hemolysin D [Bacillus thuringiensis]